MTVTLHSPRPNPPQSRAHDDADSKARMVSPFDAATDAEEERSEENVCLERLENRDGGMRVAEAGRRTLKCHSCWISLARRSTVADASLSRLDCAVPFGCGALPPSDFLFSAMAWPTTLATITDAATIKIQIRMR